MKNSQFGISVKTVSGEKFENKPKFDGRTTLNSIKRIATRLFENDLTIKSVRVFVSGGSTNELYLKREG